MMKIYLAGKIKKGSEIGVGDDWRAEYMKAISSVGSFEFLSPDDPSLDENIPDLVFGHDCYLVSRCDILIVNACSKLGVGTAQEMVIAKRYEKYVFTVLPKDSHHRRSNLQMHGHQIDDWIHPFVYCMSDNIFDSLEHACEYLLQSADALEVKPASTLDLVDLAIQAYLESTSHAELA
jgi:hypothetical protein